MSIKLKVEVTNAHNISQTVLSGTRVNQENKGSRLHTAVMVKNGAGKSNP